MCLVIYESTAAAHRLWASAMFSAMALCVDEFFARGFDCRYVQVFVAPRDLHGRQHAQHRSRQRLRPWSRRRRPRPLAAGLRRDACEALACQKGRLGGLKEGWVRARPLPRAALARAVAGACLRAAARAARRRTCARRRHLWANDHAGGGWTCGIVRKRRWKETRGDKRGLVWAPRALRNASAAASCKCWAVPKRW